MIVDLGICHDTSFEKHRKRSDTNGETVWSSVITRISHSSQPIRFEDQKELLYNVK